MLNYVSSNLIPKYGCDFIFVLYLEILNLKILFFFKELVFSENSKSV